FICIYCVFLHHIVIVLFLFSGQSYRVLSCYRERQKSWPRRTKVLTLSKMLKRYFLVQNCRENTFLKRKDFCPLGQDFCRLGQDICPPRPGLLPPSVSCHVFVKGATIANSVLAV